MFSFISLHLPSSAFNCLPFPSFPFICPNLPSSSFSCFHLSSSLFICPHLPSSSSFAFTSFICPYLPLFAFICFHLPSFAFIWLHLHSTAFISLHLPSFAFFCLHLLSFAFSHLLLLLFAFYSASSAFNCLRLISFAFICLHLHLQLQRLSSPLMSFIPFYPPSYYAFICICLTLSSFALVCLHLSSPSINFAGLPFFIQWSLHPNKSEVKSRVWTCWNTEREKQESISWMKIVRWYRGDLVCQFEKWIFAIYFSGFTCYPGVAKGHRSPCVGNNDRLGGLKCWATGLDESLSFLSMSLSYLQKWSPSLLPVSPMCIFIA